VTPFVLIQIIALLMVIFFPAIVLHLPMSMR
jgi:TRAP-type mannitol/chloroaromatic compound transport system permease large subunit